jgi:hypothetical protein
VNRRTLEQGILVLLVYALAAITVLPLLIVSLSGDSHDATVHLNAIIATRGTLLGVLGPMAVVLGGIAAVRTYQGARAENIRTKRAETYANFLSACSEYWQAARIQNINAMDEKRAAMDLAHARLMLLGPDTVQAAAKALVNHTSAEVATKAIAEPRPSETEWNRLTTEHESLYQSFLDAARKDLASIRTTIDP